MRFNWFVFILFSLPFFATAQWIPTSLNHLYHQEIDKAKLTSTTLTFSASKPYFSKEVDALLPKDSVKRAFSCLKEDGFWNKKLLRNHLLWVDSSEYQLSLDIIFNSVYGRNLQEKKDIYTNARGLKLAGNIGKNFSFYSTYQEVQAVYNNYVNQFISTYNVIPGNTWTRPYFGGAKDFGIATGGVVYAPSKYVMMQFAHDKNFIGNGYRSLLLSDNANAYTFLKLRTTLWRFQYTNIFSSLIDAHTPRAPYASFAKKYATMHFLEYKVNQRLSIGLFESIMWHNTDSLGIDRGYEVSYLNPIIFYHPVNFSLGSPDNALLGFNISYKLAKKTMLYYQLVIDDYNTKMLVKERGFFQNKTGFQLGYKGFDVFRIPHLNVLVEYNRVRPYTYAHRTVVQNYVHYNQALAHPLGANFQEIVALATYKQKHIYYQYKFNYALYGADTNNTHWGKDLFKSDYLAQRENNQYSIGNVVGQGLQNHLLYSTLEIGYMMNPITHMNVFIQATNRIQYTNDTYRLDNFFQVGFRTSLTNEYLDF